MKRKFSPEVSFLPANLFLLNVIPFFTRALALCLRPLRSALFSPKLIQIKSNQIKSNQIKSNQIKSNQIKSQVYNSSYLMLVCLITTTYHSLQIDTVAMSQDRGSCKHLTMCTDRLDYRLRSLELRDSDAEISLFVQKLFYLLFRLFLCGLLC